MYRNVAENNPSADTVTGKLIKHENRKKRIMRNQMVKRIAAVLLAGVMLVSLAACGENKKTEEKAADEQQERDRDPGIHRRKSEYSYDRTC